MFRLCADLCKKRPFMLSYEPRASMAFVDVLYNPAGVVLYGSSPEVTATIVPSRSVDTHFNLNDGISRT